VPVNQGDQVVCTITNQRRGTIRIIKDAVPDSTQAFAFTGSLGPFSLVDDGVTAGANQRTFTGLAPGSFTVTETVPAGWTLGGIACSGATATVTGATVTIPLPPAGAVACTFKNNQDTVPPIPPIPPIPPVPPDPPPEPPVPPTPPAPPAPPPDTGGGISGGGVTPPKPPALTRISLTKRCPATAAPGQVVTCTLTVSNIGKVTAKGVRIRDYPSARVQLTLIRSNAKPRLAGGTATWAIGTLAPGARRTIRASVRIEEAAPGTARNLAIASATNAKSASAISDTLIRTALPAAVVPAVTG